MSGQEWFDIFAPTPLHSSDVTNAFQEMAEMYVGDDVSPDFYGWVFPKYDHVGVGTGTVVNRPAIKDYQVRLVSMGALLRLFPGWFISLSKGAETCSTLIGCSVSLSGCTTSFMPLGLFTVTRLQYKLPLSFARLAAL